MAYLRDAIEWIAVNDNVADDHPGNPDAVRNVKGYLTTALVADVWGVQTEYVAGRVMAHRKTHTERG